MDIIPISFSYRQGITASPEIEEKQDANSVKVEKYIMAIHQHDDWFEVDLTLKLN